MIRWKDKLNRILSIDFERQKVGSKIGQGFENGRFLSVEDGVSGVPEVFKIGEVDNVRKLLFLFFFFFY